MDSKTEAIAVLALPCLLLLYHLWLWSADRLLGRCCGLDACRLSIVAWQGMELHRIRAIERPDLLYVGIRVPLRISRTLVDVDSNVGAGRFRFYRASRNSMLLRGGLFAATDLPEEALHIRGRRLTTHSTRAEIA